MKNLLKWLSGKKTYIVAFSGVVSAVAAYATGQISTFELVASIFGGTGLATLRSGVANDVKKIGG